MNIRCEKCGDVYVKTLERGWETVISGLCSKHTFQEQQEETKLRIERDELRVKLREAEQKAGAAKVAAKAWEDDYNIAKRALEVLQKDFAMTRNLQQENQALKNRNGALHRQLNDVEAEHRAVIEGHAILDEALGKSPSPLASRIQAAAHVIVGLRKLVDDIGMRLSSVTGPSDKTVLERADEVVEKYQAQKTLVKYWEGSTLAWQKRADKAERQSETAHRVQAQLARVRTHFDELAKTFKKLDEEGQ